MTLVILTGQIDISVGSLFAICGVVAGLLAKAGLPLPLVAAGACAAGRGARRAQRRARRLRPHSVDRRHAGDDGGAARRAALGDRRARGSRICRSGSSGSGCRRRSYPLRRRRYRGRRSSRRSPGACGTSPAGRAVYATGSNRGRGAPRRHSDTAFVTFAAFATARRAHRAGGAAERRCASIRFPATPASASR